jgi:phospholipase C
MRELAVACVVAAACHATHHDAPDAPSRDAPATRDAMPDAPTPIPIKHVVVVVKENHTFDNYFGSFPGADGIAQIATSHGVIAPPHAPLNTGRDLCHDHPCALVDWAGGAMNGWDLVAGASVNGDNLVYAQYQESDIPNYWQYARHFALADRFFANVLGPSFPGHTFVLAAQDGWGTSNPDNVPSIYWGCDQAANAQLPVTNQVTCQDEQRFPCFDIPSVPDVLPAGVDWKFYGTNFYLLPEIWSMFDAIKSIRMGPGWANVVTASTFDADADSGNLPAVSWLVDQDLADEHPQVGDVCVGENWTVGHLNHIMNNPQLWAETAILFTMDDFGGWYDHVAPPRQYGCDPTHPFGLGFRLPLVAISPYAKPGFIFHEISEQASIPRFIERVFGATKTLSDLDPAAQDGQANDLMNAFDFTQQPLPALPLQQRFCL